MGRAGCWQLAVWMYQEVPVCCWAGCRAERVGQRQDRGLGHWQGESVSLYLSLWGLMKVGLLGIGTYPVNLLSLFSASSFTLAN